MASKYSKRHYEDVASLMFKRVAIARRHPIDHFMSGMMTSISGDFADLFADDNPRFDRERFLKACGLDA